MNIVIVGNGKVGFSLAEQLIQEDHDVTIVDLEEDTLHRAGVRCTVQRTPKWMEEKGCGYSLKMDCRDLMPAAMLLTVSSGWGRVSMTGISSAGCSALSTGSTRKPLSCASCTRPQIYSPL